MTRSISTDTLPTTGPSAAERIRSACARTEDAVLAIAGSDPVPCAVHHIRASGNAVIVIGADSAASALTWQAGAGGLPAVLELTDRTSLPLREPVRSLVWLRGTVQSVDPSVERTMASEVAAEKPDPALLDIGHTTTLVSLRLDSAVIADSTGAESVTPDALRYAAPDPFSAVEEFWLRHLHEDHGDVLALLARRLPPAVRHGAIHPLAVDRYGLSLRVESSGADHDVRLPFAEPVEDLAGLSRAVRVLIGCPFLNGLRNRG